jgi:hypothetical protein
MKKKIITNPALLALAASALIGLSTIQASAYTLSADETAILTKLATLTGAPTFSTATADQLAQATVLAITTNPNKLPIARAITAAFSLGDQGAATGVYNSDARNADTLILQAVVKSKASSVLSVNTAVQAALIAIRNTQATSRLSLASNVTAQDKTAVAAALTSAAVSGITSTSLSVAKKTAAIKGAVGFAVKYGASLTVSPTSTAAQGGAGVVTGAISLVQLVASQANNIYVQAVVQAAILKAKTQYLDIVQAATEAAVVVYGIPTSPIPAYDTSAILRGAKLGHAPASKAIVDRINAAILAGVTAGQNVLSQAPGFTYGVGAAGVYNYVYNSGNPSGGPVTDIVGL